MHHPLVNHVGISWLSLPVISCSRIMVSYHYKMPGKYCPISLERKVRILDESSRCRITSGHGQHQPVRQLKLQKGEYSHHHWRYNQRQTRVQNVLKFFSHMFCLKGRQKKNRNESIDIFVKSQDISGTRNGGTHLYKLYVKLMYGKTHPKIAL